MPESNAQESKACSIARVQGTEVQCGQLAWHVQRGPRLLGMGESRKRSSLRSLLSSGGGTSSCCAVQREGNQCRSESFGGGVFKQRAVKGDVHKCDNYRPISLLAVGCKLFACTPLRRLKDAGSESRIWESQTGFRSERGSTDAVFVGRRLIELAWEAQDTKLICLALDWAKAFGSVAPSSFCKALLCFGVSVQMCNDVQRDWG